VPVVAGGRRYTGGRAAASAQQRSLRDLSRFPWLRPRAANDQVQRVHQQAEAFRERAKANIDRQRASAARVRARIESRKRR
jgi:hypothetical protein